VDKHPKPAATYSRQAWAGAAASELDRLAKCSVANEVLNLRTPLFDPVCDGIEEPVLRTAIADFLDLLPGPVSRNLAPDVRNAFRFDEAARLIRQATLVNLNAPAMRELDWLPEDIARGRKLYLGLVRTLYDALFLCLVGNARLGPDYGPQQLRYAQVVAAQFLELFTALDAHKDYEACLDTLDARLSEERERCPEAPPEMLGPWDRDDETEPGQPRKYIVPSQRFLDDLVLFGELSGKGLHLYNESRAVEAWHECLEKNQDPLTHECFQLMDPDEFATFKDSMSDNPVLDLRWAKVQGDPACQAEIFWHVTVAMSKVVNEGEEISEAGILRRIKDAVRREPRTPDALRLSQLLHQLTLRSK